MKKMHDYISREELMKELKNAPPSMTLCMNVDECKGRIYERERVDRIISTIPSANVAPVRHARWNVWNVEHCLYICSACHALPVDKTPYCPICGAKMENF